MKKILFLYIILPTLTFAQKDFKGFIYDKDKNIIPFVNVFDKAGQGTISDENGKFKFNHLKDSITFSAVGYISKKIALADLESNSTITLENAVYQMKDLVVTNKKTFWLGYTPQKRKVISSILNGPYERTENGIRILNTDGLTGILKTIKVNVGNDGSIQLPLRINIYELNKDGFPKKSILRKDIVFTPKSKKLKEFKFDISEQQIELPENGICVSIELINVNKDKNAHPIYLAFWSDEYKSIANFGFENNWFPANFASPAIAVEIIKL